MRDITVVHLEPTDVCQAECALCARETDANFRKDQQHHLTIDQILKHLSDDQIAKLDKMFMCGNYGDPAAGKHTLDIYNYFRSQNPNITLGMNSNGGLQTTLWWHTLGTMFNQPKDYVVFSIDGLESTNATYRKNVKWSKLMYNAQAYIDAGDLLIGICWYINIISTKSMTASNWPETWDFLGSGPKSVNDLLQCN